MSDTDDNKDVAYYKKELEKTEKPIKELYASSVGEYINAIEAINELFGSKILFRGLSDKSYEVLSSAYRKLKDDGYDPPTLQQLKDYHSQLTKGVLALNDEGISKHKESNVDLLAHLQHMGAKTCLIDYTESSLVALWFACKHKETKKLTDGAVLVIKNRLNLNLIDDGKLSVEELFEKEAKEVYIFDPPYINRRIIIQHSIFLFSPMGKIDEYGHIAKIVIKNRYKKSIISQLRQINDIHEKTLFPDFIGFIEWFKYEDSNNERYDELIEEGNKNNDEGNYRAAINSFEQALKLKVANDIEEATIYNKLGLAYYKKGEYNKALVYYNKALDIQKRILGEDHLDAAMIYNDMGLLYAERGEYAEALKYYVKALNIQERVLGRDHLDTATTYHNIGIVYNYKGEYLEALRWYKKTLEVFESILGKEHLNTATIYNSMGLLYAKMDECDKALMYYAKVLVIQERVLGTDHPDTATTYNNIGSLYVKRGKYNKALMWYAKALVIQERVLGKDHPDTAISYDNIGTIYDKKGEYYKALEYYVKALEIFREKLGENHQYTINVKEKIRIVKEKIYKK